MIEKWEEENKGKDRKWTSEQGLFGLAHGPLVYGMGVTFKGILFSHPHPLNSLSLPSYSTPLPSSFFFLFLFPLLSILTQYTPRQLHETSSSPSEATSTKINSPNYYLTSSSRTFLLALPFPPIYTSTYIFLPFTTIHWIFVGFK